MTGDDKCPACEGWGQLADACTDGAPYTPCPDCHGTGQAPAEDAAERIAQFEAETMQLTNKCLEWLERIAALEAENVSLREHYDFEINKSLKLEAENARLVRERDAHTELLEQCAGR